MKDTFLIDVENRGMGDYLFACFIGIFFKNKFKKIYIRYRAIHFNSMIYLINRLLTENHANNIICIGEEKYMNKNILLTNNIIYFDDVNLSKEIKNMFMSMHGKLEFDSDNNCFFSFSKINDIIEEYSVYYQHFFKCFGIKSMREFTKNIIFTLNEYELIKNNELYEKLLTKIDNKKYILVFHCLVRNQHNFGFREYPNDLNKNNYKIINMCKNYDENNNTYDENNNTFYITNLLGNIPDMWMLHKIIENAEEIHLFDSYPFHYLFLLKNIEHKIIMYPRALTGYKSKLKFEFYDYNLKILNDYVNLFDIEMFFNMYESYYPINYLKINNCKNSPRILNYNQLLTNKTNFKKCVEDLSKYKVLPMIGVGNETGILVETILDNINFIEISLENINNLENIYKYIDNTTNKINKDNLLSLKESLNILTIKTEGDYFLKIKPYIKEINNVEDIYLETNIDNIKKNLIDVIDFYMENTNIHYIYPYKNEKDKEQFIEKIQIKSRKMFNNKVNFKKYNDLII